jgi:2,5-diketo-D-gluconate reductase A
LQIPKIGLGTFKLNDTHEEFMKKCIKDGGYRLIDTAQAYGNEEVVGRAVNG